MTFKFIVRGSRNISLKVLDSMPVRLFKFSVYSVEFGDEQYPVVTQRLLVGTNLTFWSRNYFFNFSTPCI